MGRVTRFTQALTCIFKKAGEYSQIFTVGVDCSSKNEAGVYRLKGCQQNYIFDVEVNNTKEKRAGLWATVSIGIIIILGLIIGTIYYVFKKKVPMKVQEEDRVCDNNNQDIKKGHYSKPSSEMAVVPAVGKVPVLDSV